MAAVVVLVSFLDSQSRFNVVLFTLSVLGNDEEFCVKEQGDENIKMQQSVNNNEISPPATLIKSILDPAVNLVCTFITSMTNI